MTDGGSRLSGLSGRLIAILAVLLGWAVATTALAAWEWSQWRRVTSGPPAAPSTVGPDPALLARAQTVPTPAAALTGSTAAAAEPPSAVEGAAREAETACTEPPSASKWVPQSAPAVAPRHASATRSEAVATPAAPASSDIALSDHVVDRLAALASATEAELEATLRLAGLDPAEVAPPRAGGHAATVGAGEGGPFVPVTADQNTTGLAASLASLDLHLDRRDELARVVRTLPLAEPLHEYRVTSPFGVRRDPILHRLGMHEGIDLAAPRLSPVFATAPGRVVFAGVKPGYGRVVEIDHGRGIDTVYGHLQVLSVRQGQRVVTGTRLGRVGSTGRSTGPHLHYEVRVNGEPRDPAQFLYTGRLILAGAR